MEKKSMLNTTNSSPSTTKDSVKHNWKFTEVWIDSLLSPPYILLLLCDSEENCQIYDPSQGYKIVFSCNQYDEAQWWLVEDGYELINGRR
jgi:hypothetical protein